MPRVDDRAGVAVNQFNTNGTNDTKAPRVHMRNLDLSRAASSSASVRFWVFTSVFPFSGLPGFSPWQWCWSIVLTSLKSENDGRQHVKNLSIYKTDVQHLPLLTATTGAKMTVLRLVIRGPGHFQDLPSLCPTAKLQALLPLQITLRKVGEYIAQR